MILKSLLLSLLLVLLPGCEYAEKVKKYLSLGERKEMNYAKVNDFSSIETLFPKDVLSIKSQVDESIKVADEQLKMLLSIKPKERTFENTARDFDIILDVFGAKLTPIHVLEITSPDIAIRDACKEGIVKAEVFSVDAFSNPELYKAFKAYIEGNAKSEAINDEQKYYLEEAMKDFVRSGLTLPDKELGEAKVIKKQLAELAIEFSSNISQDKSQISAAKEELDGADEDFVAQLKRDEKGKCILTCDYPIYFEVMDHCRVQATRKALYLVFNNRAYPENIEILKKIVALRDQLAKKIGFKSFADLHIDSAMAKTPKIAEDFILDLISKSAPKAEKELELLKSDLPEGTVLAENGQINPWDVRYLNESYKKKHFDIDDREVAKYFPMEKAIGALFNIYQKFLNLEFKISKPSWAWHEDVQLIEAYKNQVFIGYIFLDLHPRPDKYSHACHCGLIEGISDRPSAALVIANFPKASASKPSLLKHDEVLTFFHEFGHAMHFLLGRTELAAHAGTATKWDFVELPSQMFEEWMWDREILKSVSGHYETGANLPDELIDKMLKLKTFDSGYFVLRQCILSLVSLKMYAEGAEKDPTKIANDLSAKYLKDVRVDSESHFVASFGHLIGYGAKYYGYMWSRVFALDIFEAIKAKGLLNPQVGAELVAKVLGKGGSADPNGLLVDFLGREPKQDAFLKNYDII